MSDNTFVVNLTQRTHIIKQTAAELGFDFCGVAKAVRLEEDARRLEAWLNHGYHGTLHYMENYFDLRTDPTKLVPGAKSVITMMKNYYPEERQNENAPKIAKFAYGEDYHEIIRARLNSFLEKINTGIGEVHGRGFVDSAPVLEKAWAVRSGLGWVGKNGLLLNTETGSFHFICTLIVDMELEYDAPAVKDFCGTCTRCIDACPTDAILPNKVINASRCISYFTIELKDMLIPQEMESKFENWMFGCDICQDVCPWNRFSKPHHDEAFRPIAEILDFTTKEWKDLTEDSFRKLFRHSPLKRSKYKGIMRNLKFLSKGN